MRLIKANLVKIIVTFIKRVCQTQITEKYREHDSKKFTNSKKGIIKLIDAPY